MYAVKPQANNSHLKVYRSYSSDQEKHKRLIMTEIKAQV